MSTGCGPPWSKRRDWKQSLLGRRRFWRDRQGRYHPELEAPEKALLVALPREAQGIVARRDSSTLRVFPVAYPNDDKAESDYRELMGEQLSSHHQHVLDTLASTCESASIDQEELHLWLGALEVLRLIVGTQLDVSENMASLDTLVPNDPKAQQLGVYQYLSMLQSEIIDVLAEQLPEEGTGTDDEIPALGGELGDVGDESLIDGLMPEDPFGRDPFGEDPFGGFGDHPLGDDPFGEGGDDPFGT